MLVTKFGFVRTHQAAEPLHHQFVLVQQEHLHQMHLRLKNITKKPSIALLEARKSQNSAPHAGFGLTFGCIRPILLTGLEISGRQKSSEELRGFLFLWVAFKSCPFLPRKFL